MSGRVYAVEAPKAKKEISAEGLVQWTYHDQRADLTPGGGGPGGAPSMFESFSDAAQLGWVIGGSSSSAGIVHEDASMVYDLISRMGPAVRQAVSVHGFMRTRPDPRIGARHRLVPRDWDVFENPLQPGCYLRSPRTDVLKRKGEGVAWYVPLVEIDKPFDIKRDRAEWSAWAEGLHAIHEQLAHGLTAHVLTAELPDRAPWAGDSRAKGAGAAQNGAESRGV